MLFQQFYKFPGLETMLLQRFNTWEISVFSNNKWQILGKLSVSILLSRWWVLAIKFYRL